MGWDAETIASAMGIAASSSGGLLAFFNTGAITKRLHPVRAGQLGAEAAFMAHAGVAGPAIFSKIQTASFTRFTRTGACTPHGGTGQ
jgi:2-methylcitrate dehydratase PrpD